jgi:hypothetical protein
MLKALRNAQERSIWLEMEMLKAKVLSLEMQIKNLRSQLYRDKYKEEELNEDPNAHIFGIGRDKYKNDNV